MLLDPKQIQRNPENPRLIFREDELRSLEESIKEQGILVPLTVFTRKGEKAFVLLDGERRWRCATKLGLGRVPAIVQPEPDRLQNIMMMFAIHNARKDWDPLPTAFKLRDLEKLFTERQGVAPTESQLSQLASMPRGEVRRLKKLLGLPKSYINELIEELEKPKSKQTLTVDQVLEATKGVQSLRKQKIIEPKEEDGLRRAIISKFKSGVINNTTAPRKLARLARAVVRKELSRDDARTIVARLQNDPKFSIDQAFEESAAQADFQHTVEQAVDRLSSLLDENKERGYRVPKSLKEALARLAEKLRSSGFVK